MFNIGPIELAIIFVLVLLVFGPKRLPEISRAMGKGMKMLRDATREVRGSMADLQAEVEREIRDAERAKDDFKKSLFEEDEDDDTRSDAVEADFSIYDPAAEDRKTLPEETTDYPDDQEDTLVEEEQHRQDEPDIPAEEKQDEEDSKKASGDEDPDDSSRLAG